jgi:hypothetical protein
LLPRAALARREQKLATPVFKLLLLLPLLLPLSQLLKAGGAPEVICIQLRNLLQQGRQPLLLRGTPLLLTIKRSHMRWCSSQLRRLWHPASS